MGTLVRRIWTSRRDRRSGGARGVALRRPAVATLGLALAFASGGCKAVYAPNIANAPLLQQKGELRATADLRNLQLAYAVGSHVGVMANAYYRSEDTTLEGGERQAGNGGLIEVGGGAFTRLARPDWLHLEVYGGAGVGSVHHEITPSGGTKRTFDAEGVRLFVMPAAGVSLKYFDVAVSARVVGVSYHDAVAENYTMADLEGDRLESLEDRMWWFFEPALTVRGGYKWVKVQLQFGQSFKLNSQELNHDKGMLTVALHLDLFRAFDPPEE